MNFILKNDEFNEQAIIWKIVCAYVLLIIYTNELLLYLIGNVSLFLNQNKKKIMLLIYDDFMIHI